MRAAVVPFALWAAALQVVVPAQTLVAGLSAASALASLTVLVYRLGVCWQEMFDLKNNLGAEVARHREASAQSLARLEGRFASIDRFIAAAIDF